MWFVKMIKTHKEIRPSAHRRPADYRQWTDEQLLAGYRQQGDSRYFGELVRRYERELYSYLYRFLGDASMAEDTFQATFLQVHLKHDQFTEGRRVRPWLYAIATNKAIDAQRRNRRHRLVSLDRGGQNEHSDLGTLVDMVVHRDPGPAARLEQYEARQWVQESICQLPESLRAVVNLVYFQGMKYREAADTLSVPVGTVKSRMHSAISRLYDAWTEGNPAE